MTPVWGIPFASILPIMGRGRRLNSIETVHGRGWKTGATAEAHARKLAPIIREIRQAGYLTAREMSEELNRLRVRTLRGGPWHPSTVARLLSRLRRVVDRPEAQTGQPP
jgi:hypothetical protein